MSGLMSARVGQYFVGEHRLEYTEYSSGRRTVVLLHGQLMPRTMHDPLARTLAAEGYRVVTLDLLGHGRSDRPADAGLYSMAAFASQVVALLDHLEVDSAVVGGTSLGANVSLEVAVAHPERVRGLLLEMPVLDNALEAGLIVFAPLMFAARYVPLSVYAVGAAARLVPRARVPLWAEVLLDTVAQRPAAMEATIKGIFFGRIAPCREQRRGIQVPALVIGHPYDPIHPAADAAMLAGEMPRARFVPAQSVLEWHRRPERINDEVLRFLSGCWIPRRSRQTRRTS
ncbi:MAG: alpha/beta fold hydrolase [Nocardioidaceae bacterium]